MRRPGPRPAPDEGAVRVEGRCDLREVQRQADSTIPVLQDAIRDFRRLNPPEAQENTVDSWLEAVDELENDLEEIRDEADNGSMKGVQAVVPKAAQHNKRSNELAAQLGMTVCNTD